MIFLIHVYFFKLFPGDCQKISKLILNGIFKLYYCLTCYITKPDADDILIEQYHSIVWCNNTETNIGKK